VEHPWLPQALALPTIFRDAFVEQKTLEMMETTRNKPVASLLVTSGSFSSDFEPFSEFENWSSQWLSRGNLYFHSIAR